MTSGDSWTGLIKIIAFIVIFVMINLSIVNLCMQLINVVPDNIIDWIGGRLGGALGKNGVDEVGGMANKSMAGASWMRQKDRNKTSSPTSKSVEGNSLVVKPPVVGGSSGKGAI